MRPFRRVITIAVLPAVHLCLCCYIATSGDIWEWMLLSLSDFPLLYIQEYVGDRLGFVLISPLRVTLLGTAWWLCLGFALEWAIRRYKTGRAI